MLEDKDMYQVEELFDELPMTVAEFSRQSGINQVTIARMRSGHRTRRDTVVKILTTMSRIFGKPLSAKNVTGINMMTNKRLENK